MKVYVEVSDAVVEASKDLFQNQHEIYDKQFDNVWVKPGMRVFEKLVQTLDEDVFESHVSLFNEKGEELSPDHIAETLDQNNVIWQ